MSLVVNNNLMAANVARNLNQHYGRLQTSTQRLSSGLRINSAADDAAGLAIRELQRADIAALHQGARNANDAISMIQVADGALGVIDEKLIRMKELAEQAATGTYSSTQRLMIESEYQAMASEITRIANATDFNGMKLLDGTLSSDKHDGSGLSAKDGLSSTGKMKIHFGTANDSAEDYYYITIGNCTAAALGVGNSAWKVDGTAGKYTIEGELLNGKAVLKNESYINAATNAVATPDETKLYNVYTGVTSFTDDGAPTPTAGVTTVYEKDGQYYRWDAGNNALVAGKMEGGTPTQSNGYNVQIEITPGTALPASPTEYYKPAYVFAADGRPVNGDAAPSVTKGEVEVTPVKAGTYYDANGVEYKPNGDVFEVGTAQVAGGQPQLVYKKDGEYYLYDAATPKFDKIQDQSTVQNFNASIDPATRYPLLAEAGAAAGDPVTNFYQPEYIGPDDKPLTQAQAATVKSGNIIYSDGYTVSTQEAAQKALNAINMAIESKDKIRAHLGAMQNRLENTITNLNVQAENLQAAESRISDVDVATEMTQFVRNQILTQSAVAMLGQANSLPQMAMQLIGG